MRHSILEKAIRALYYRGGFNLSKNGRSAAVAFFILLFSSLILSQAAFAGPPFRTDDPEPVEFQHWEVYLASQYANSKDGQMFTLPHFEVNYGVIPDVQLHVIAPLEYVKPSGGKWHYGYGDTELGVKWRFLQETDQRPMMGIFPMVEVPTGAESRGLGNGDAQVFLPLWLQKSWGSWQSYGGGGYWFNPGKDHRDFYFVGWQIQREFSKTFTMGAEVFRQGASQVGGDASTGFNIGGFLNFTENHHLLLSVGRDFDGPNRFTSYIAYQWTFGCGPEDEKDKKPE